MYTFLKIPGLAAWRVFALAALCAMVFASCCSSDAGPIIPSSNPLPPVAAILAQPSAVPDSLECAFDAHESFDTDGTIVRYDWDWTTDGTYDVLDGGVTHSFTYPAAGTYRATVRVTDNDGLTDTASILVTVPLAENPPTAVGTAVPGTVNPLLVRFDASTSFDTDGTIVRYDWDFNHDGAFELTDGGATPEYAFPGIGTYTVTVRVFDNDGLSDTADITVNITQGQGGNLVPPDAVLTPDPVSGIAPLGVEWDASASTDSDGTIVRYDWDMDGNGVFELIDGGAKRAVSYLTGGDYTVAVRVLDDDGGMDAALATVNVNDEPVALATSDPSAGDLAQIQATMKMTGSGSILVTYDGTTSFDPDGTIAQYDWDLDNDGEFEIINGDATQPVTYTASGVWAVALRVTDNEGATDTGSAGANINEPPTARLQPDPPSGTLASNQQSSEPELAVRWFANTSFDPDGQVVQWDWDMNDDGTFEIIDGPSNQDVSYTVSGQYTVRVRVTDNDGATEIAINSVDVNAPPVADVVADPTAGSLAYHGEEETPTLEVTYDASGSTDSDGTIVRYDWDLDNNAVFEVENGGPTQTVTYDTPGLKIVAVKVHDDDDATDNAATSVEINNPPTAVLNADYTELPTEDKNTSAVAQLYWVTWDATESYDADGTIVQYDWDTDNDGEFDVIDGESTQSEVFEAKGTYTMGVRVTDDKGATGTTYTPFEVVGMPPVAILYPYAGTEDPLRIVWTGSYSYDQDGTIVKYEWDFENDGVFDESTFVPMINHTYSSFGTHTCALRVTDNDGLTDTDTYQVVLATQPIAEVTGTFHFETVEPYRPYIVWDASDSFDPDGGNIVQFNWDPNNDLIFEVQDGGETYTSYYNWDMTSANIWVEVIDDEGESGYAYASLDFGQAPPFAMLSGNSGEGYMNVFWDASESFDLDGTIVLYEWDYDNDGTYDDSGTDTYYWYTYDVTGWVTCRVRATDDDGLTDTATANYYILDMPPGPF
jgi:PKD repeat protein